MITLNPSKVTFIEGAHKYFLDGRELKGITSSLVHRAFPHMYDDVSEATLKRAAERGTKIHKAIQAFEDTCEIGDIDELIGYADIKNKHHLVHVASEYLVSDNDTYASSIDHVYMQDDNIVLADIKTTYKPKYESVALQLSIYKRLFEMQNPDLKVSKIALIWLRGEKAMYRELKVWPQEMLDSLFKADAEDTEFDITTTYGDLPVKFADAEDEIVRIETELKAMKERSDELKSGLYDLMEQFDVKSFTGAKVRLTRILPSTSSSFDQKRFKEENPELYAQYTKSTTKAGSLRITIQ